MKKWLCLIVIAISAFLLNEHVYAANVEGAGVGAGANHNLSNKNYTLECIYDDGNLFTYEYSVGKSKFVTNRLSYNIVGASNSNSNAGGDVTFVNGNMLSITEDNNTTVLSCPSNEYSTSYNDGLYFKFGTPFSCPEDSEECPDFNVQNSGWCNFWGCSNKETKEAINAAKNQQTAKLLSERFIMSNNAEEPNATLYYVMYAEQASGVNAYIKIIIYDNVVLLEKDGRVTRLTGDLVTDEFSKITVEEKDNQHIIQGLRTDLIFINSPEPNPVTTSSSSISYSFNDGQTMYSVTKTKDNIHKYPYKYTDSDPDPNKVDDSLCTQRLKNTSPILKNVIKYSQLLIPILVIVITSIDIGKVALSGNIEEELPKKKKMIINRFIIMVVFFFLPLFIKLSIKLIKDAGIGEGNSISDGIQYIDCLFE